MQTEETKEEAYRAQRLRTRSRSRSPIQHIYEDIPSLEKDRGIP